MGAADRTEEAATWPDHLRVAVNLSPLQFNDPTSSAWSAQISQRPGCAPKRLELEITEGVFLADGDIHRRHLRQLKELGVRLALDDFGTGYSSLGYLKKAPFDKIKIDQSFVRGAVVDHQPQRRHHPRHRDARRNVSAWTPAPRASRPTTTSS